MEATYLRNIFLITITLLAFVCCNSIEKYKHDLDSKNHPTNIAKAAYFLGQIKDTGAIGPLLTNVLDPRMSTNLRFKGMTMCYCKLVALRKITGVEPPKKLNQFRQDTSVAEFYLNLAIERGYIKTRDQIDLTYAQ